MLKKFLPVLLALAAVLLTVSLTASAQPLKADGPNLLTNPGLEGHYNQQCSQVGQPPWIQVVPACDPTNYDFHTLNLWATAQVPFGWSAWWRVPNDDQKDPNYFNSYPAYCDFSKDITPDSCVPWHNPEFRDTAGGPQETGPSRRMEGDNSQKYFTFYTIHEAGLYQVVSGVTPGQRLRFSAYMEAWSSAHNDPFRSEGQPTMGMQVGIDPFGGNNPWSANIIWSPVKESFDQFSQFTVEAIARNSIVSVWTRSHPQIPQEHNDVYVDAASLNVIGTATIVNRSTSGYRVVTSTKVITLSSGLTQTVVTTSTVRPTFVNTSTVIAPNEYVVVLGDSLTKIAKKFGLHWADIAALNPVIKPPAYKIYVGQVIKLKP
jgi:LysM repeat protein